LRDARPVESEPAHNPNHDWRNDPNDPRCQLNQMWDRSVEAARVEEREAAEQEIARLEALVAEQASEIEELRAARAKAVEPVRPAVLPPPCPAESTPPQPVSGDEAKDDRSAYAQQGLRPAGGELWRPFVGGSNSGIFWGGSGGRSW